VGAANLAVYVWMPVVDPLQPNIVYAGTQGDGLWKSLDYGDTWTRLDGLPDTVQGLTVDPANNSHVFARRRPASENRRTAARPG
jgi:hypothetical protein